MRRQGRPATRVAAVLGGLVDAPEDTVFDALSAACVREFAITGAGVTCIIDGVARGSLGASDKRSLIIEQLQFTLGEGPCLDAHLSRTAVSAPRLALEPVRWPAYRAGAVEAGVEAVFAFPLQVGGQRLGALDFYRDTPGPLAPGEFEDACAVAEASSSLIMAMQTELADGVLAPAFEQMVDYRAVIHQAAGMISVQIDSSVDDALVALRARAFQSGKPIEVLATDVVAGRVRFDAL